MFLNCIFQTEAILDHPVLTTCAMSVTLKKQHFIIFKDEKWVIPEALVYEKLGKQWLLMNATNYSLCKLIQGSKIDNKRNYNLKNIPAFDELIQQRNIKSNLVPKDDLFDGGDPAKPATKKRKLVPKEDEEIQLILPEEAGSISCLSAKKVSEVLAVEMAEANLSLIFDFFHGSDTTSEKSRSYSSSGKYVGVAAKRKSKKDTDAASDNDND